MTIFANIKGYLCVYFNIAHFVVWFNEDDHTDLGDKRPVACIKKLIWWVVCKIFSSQFFSLVATDIS